MFRRGASLLAMEFRRRVWRSFCLRLSSFVSSRLPVLALVPGGPMPIDWLREGMFRLPRLVDLSLLSKSPPLLLRRRVEEELRWSLFGFSLLLLLLSLAMGFTL